MVNGCSPVWKAHFEKSGGPFLLPTVYPLALFCLRKHAFLLQHLDQGRHFPHAGESQFFEGDNLFGVKGLGHAVSLNGESAAQKSRRR